VISGNIRNVERCLAVEHAHVLCSRNKVNSNKEVQKLYTETYPRVQEVGLVRCS
jgi:hypothetical protein